MTYFEKFRRRFFKDVDKLINNQNRVHNAIPQRLRQTTTKDIIRFTLDSLRQELIKIFDDAKQQTQKEKQKKLTDMDKTRQFLKEVCKITDEDTSVVPIKVNNTYEIVVTSEERLQAVPGHKIAFVFDEIMKFDHIRIEEN
jgi:hypothetical protein